MPILEKTDGGLPRSVLRYRPTTADTITVHEYVTGATTPVLPVRRTSRVRQSQADDGAVEQDALDAAQMGLGAPTATKARRAPTMPKTLPHTPRPKQTTRPRSRLHPLFFLGTGMLATLALIAMLSIVTSWFTTTLDDLRYGRPRTFQVDAYVGHNESPGTLVIFWPSTCMDGSRSSNCQVVTPATPVSTSAPNSTGLTPTSSR